jgi:hypothetical protein
LVVEPLIQLQKAYGQRSEIMANAFERESREWMANFRASAYQMR